MLGLKRFDLIRGLTIAGIAALTGCSSPTPAPCSSLGADARVVCGFRNPEDIRRLPDGRTLLISEISALGRQDPGRLVFFDTQTRAITPAFSPPRTVAVATAAEAPWGEASCPGAPGAEFSPVGLSVQQRVDGRWQVAAVNHGGRMSVEMFELHATPAGHQLAWRGCVPAPARVALNSVALLRSGGFVASHMFDPTAAAWFGLNTSLLKAELGGDSGHVLEWEPAQPGQVGRFRVLADSAGPFPNGIALSADERTIFLALSAGHELRRLDRVSGRRTGSVRVQRPDNLSWDEQGYLLVASLRGSLAQNLHCVQRPNQPCGLAFEVVRVAPQSLHTEVVLAQQGSPMGAATVAQQLGPWLYLGSFTGDRILRLPLRP